LLNPPDVRLPGASPQDGRGLPGGFRTRRIKKIFPGNEHLGRHLPAAAGSMLVSADSGSPSVGTTA